MRIRKAERDRRRADLADALQAERVLQQRMTSLLTEQVSADEQAREAASAGEVNVDALIHHHRYLATLAAQQQVLQQQDEQLGTETQRRRDLLVEADRDVKALEKLEEQQREEFEAGVRKREEAELDDVVRAMELVKQRLGD